MCGSGARLGLARAGCREPVAAQDVAEALARAPQNLIELHVGQLQGLPNRDSRLLAQVEALETFPVGLHGQMVHEIANTLRELLMVQPLLERQRLVLQIGKQLAIAVVPAGELSAPVRRRELACRPVEVAAQVARILQSL